MKKKALSLSIAVILSSGILTGCGGSDNKKAVEEVDKVQPPVEQNIISGVLCLDQNLNLECDANEVKATDLTDNEIPTELQSSISPTLFKLTSGGLYLAAPQNTEISAYSTLVYNEIMFNPSVNASLTDASAYLETKGITKTSITEQEEKWLASIKNAIEVESQAHPYKAIAALVNKVVEDSSKFDQTVTADEISLQNFVKKELSLTSKQVSWEESDHDEGVRDVVALKGRNLAVAGTYYHNSLVVIDTSTDEPQLKAKNLFAAVDAPRYTKDSRSGASEHSLRAVKSSPDGQHVYVSVVPKGDIGNELDDTYGLFRVAVSDEGVADSHNAPNTKRFIHENVGLFFITDDGQVIVEDADQEDFIVLNSDLTETGDRISLPVEIDFDSVHFSPDGQFIYLLTKGDSAVDPVVYSQLHKINRTTGEIEKAQYLSVTGGIDGLKFFDNGKQALAFEEDYYAQVINLEQMEVSKKLPLSEDAKQNIQTATVTPNGKYAIIAGHDKAQAWIFDLDSPEVRIDKLVSFDSTVRSISVTDNGQIITANRDGFMDISDITVGDIITPERSIALDKQFLTKENINSGLDLDIIVSDLSLFNTVPAGAGTNIDWQTTNTAINVIASEEHKLGEVTRDLAGDSTGTLTANISYNFRDIAKTEQVVFETSVRQAPEALPEQGSALAGGQFNQGYVNYIDVSPSGEHAMAVYRGLGGFNLITRSAEDDSPQYALSTGKTEDEKGIIGQQLPAPYAYVTKEVDGKTKVINESRPVGIQYLSEDYAIVAVPSATNENDDVINGALLVYKVDSQAIADGEAVLIGEATSNQFGGKIKSMSHLVNGHIAIVVEMTQGEETSRKAVILDVSDPANLVQVGDDIKVSEHASAIEVSNDAHAVFVVNEDKIAKYTSAGNGTPTHETSADIEDLSVRSLAIGGTNNDTLFVGTSSGVARVFQFNTSDLTSNNNQVFNTGYFSRVQTIDVIGTTAYISVWGYGISVVDTQTQKELNFFEHGRQRRAGISQNGEWIFAAQYISRSTNEIRVLKLAK